MIEKLNFCVIFNIREAPKILELAKMKPSQKYVALVFESTLQLVWTPELIILLYPVDKHGKKRVYCRHALQTNSNLHSSPDFANVHLCNKEKVNLSNRVSGHMTFCYSKIKALPEGSEIFRNIRDQICRNPQLYLPSTTES